MRKLKPEKMYEELRKMDMRGKIKENMYEELGNVCFTAKVLLLLYFSLSFLI